MYLRSEKKLHKRYALQIVLRATEIFSRECTVVDVTIPEGLEITVYGDVHGQYYDLLNTFDFNGAPSASNPVIFNGDFVDRGSFSVEIILVLLALKCCYPQSVFLNRGNHETENMNKIYGFEGEVKAKLGMEYMRPFADCFRAMPLACVIDSKILVLHGGLFSQDGVTLDMMRKVNRFMEPPDAGIMTDMLWSDPQRMPGRSPSKRGVGVQFGPDVTKRFLDANNLKMLIRSHECKDRGYEVRALFHSVHLVYPVSLTPFFLQIEADGRLVTIFSAPNYCDQMGNEGAIIRIGKDLECKYKQFKAVPHPQVCSVVSSAFLGQRSFLAGAADGLRWRRRLHEPIPIASVNSVALRINNISATNFALWYLSPIGILIFIYISTICKVRCSIAAARNLLLQMLYDGAQPAHYGSLPLVHEMHQRRGYAIYMDIRTAAPFAAFPRASNADVLHSRIDKSARGFPLQQLLQAPPQHFVLLLQL